MSPATDARWPVRVGLGLCVFVYLLYSSFGIAAPYWWGHHGYHGATYTLRALMTLRHHILTPATWMGFEPPPKAALYFHHPVGYHYILSLLIPIFGKHEWLARGVAVAGGLVALFALYRLVARCWSREAGLVAVVIYVCLPILASFSVLSDPMLLEMAAVLWGLWAYLSLLERPSRRLLVHAFFAYALGGFVMWEVYFIGPFIALHALCYRFTRRGRELRLGRFSALDLHTLVIGTACCLMMGFHLWFTIHSDVWNDFIASYRLRHAAPPWSFVLERHEQWISLLYGWPPVAVGGLWLAVWLVRLVRGQGRRRDLAPLTFLYVNTLYIYLFAEGSSVHLYRVFFYSSFFTLALTDLVCEAAAVAGRWAPRRVWLAPCAGGALLTLYLAAELPHTLHNLLESRVMMGTHGQLGYSPHRRKLRFAAEVHARTSRDERVIIDARQLGARKELWYYLDRNFDEIQSLAELGRLRRTQPKSVLILDEQQLSGVDRIRFDELLQHHPVIFFEHFAMVDLRSNRPEVSSYAFVERPMSRAYRWFVSHHYRPLALVPRAYLPGECKALALGVPVPATEELEPPALAALLPCYHNLLVLRGQHTAARRVMQRLATGMRAMGGTLNSADLLAERVEPGSLSLLWRAHGPLSGALRYRLSQDGKPGPILPSTAPLASRWQPGFLYLDRVSLPKGTYQAEAELVGAAAAGQPPPVLARAPLGPLDPTAR